MEEYASTFTYLGEDMLQQTLATFAQNIQKFMLLVLELQ